MQPIVHPVVGYLCYAGYIRARRENPPQGGPVIVAVFAAILPDMIDRSLWLIGVTSVGRTIAHSLLGAIVLVGGMVILARAYHRSDLGVAFAIGYFSHILADIPWHILAGDYHELGFLLWPVTEMPAYSGVKVVANIGSVEITTLWLEGGLFLLGVLVWWRDGCPGTDVLRGLGRNQ